MNSGLAVSQEMNRNPVPMNCSGVSGIAAWTSLIRSQGFSRWVRTAIPMWVLEVKSRARKPARSMTGAICSIWPVVSPVAPHRLWLPSRNETSSRSISLMGHRRPPPVACRAAGITLEEAGGHSARCEVGIAGQPAVQRQVGLDPGDLTSAQRAPEPAERTRAVSPARDELGEKGVVVRRHHRSGLDPGIDPDAGAGRERGPGNGARAGPPGPPVLRVDAAFDRVAGQGHLFRGQPQRPAFRHRDLLGDQVQPGHRLGDRVLHLDTRIHLQEEEGAAIGVDEEFDGAETAIAQPGAEADRGVEYRGPETGIEIWGRCLLDHLLVPPLDRAVTLAEMDDPVAVAEQLDLDMPGVGDETFQVDPRIAERGARLGGCLLRRRGQLARCVG